MRNADSSRLRFGLVWEWVRAMCLHPSPQRKQGNADRPQFQRGSAQVCFFVVAVVCEHEGTWQR